jgi:hypothetical protein
MLGCRYWRLILLIYSYDVFFVLGNKHLDTSHPKLIKIIKPVITNAHIGIFFRGCSSSPGLFSS